MDGKATSGTAHEIYSTFINHERKYGHLSTFSDQLRAKWQHLRASTSNDAFWMYYECSHQLTRNFQAFTYCPDATQALFLICNCPDVRSYHVGDLLKLRADPNCQSLEEVDTPLHRLIKLNKVKGVRLLLNWGANLNRPNTTGRTPLMVACDSVENKKQLLIVKNLLQDRDVDIDACDKDGNSAAIYAIGRSNIWTLRELLMKGVSVSAASHKRRCFSVDEHQCHLSALDISRQLWRSATSTHCNRGNILDMNRDTEKSVDNSHTEKSIDSNGTRSIKLDFGKHEEITGNSTETSTESDTTNTDGSLAIREGIQWAQRMTFATDCMRRRKEEVCFLMILRKARLEAFDATNATDRLRSLQKIYRKDDIRSNPSSRKLEGAKQLRILHLETPASWIECINGETDVADVGFSKTVEDAEMQRDRKILTKYVLRFMQSRPLSESESMNGIQTFIETNLLP